MTPCLSVYWILVSVFITGLFADLVSSLHCWHCIADNCDMNPSENYKATKKECQPNQCCQKVFFEMHSTTDNTIYTSTIRSCAGDCDSHDDWENCTDELYTTRGCVKKTCCVDQDYCNTANTLNTYRTWMTSCVILSVAFTLHAVLTCR